VSKKSIVNRVINPFYEIIKYEKSNSTDFEYLNNHKKAFINLLFKVLTTEVSDKELIKIGKIFKIYLNRANVNKQIVMFLYLCSLIKSIKIGSKECIDFIKNGFLNHTQYDKSFISKFSSYELEMLNDLIELEDAIEINIVFCENVSFELLDKLSTLIYSYAHFLIDVDTTLSIKSLELYNLSKDVALLKINKIENEDKFLNQLNNILIDVKAIRESICENNQNLNFYVNRLIDNLKELKCQS